MDNWLKSVFVILYMLATLALAGFGIWKIAGGGDPLAWSGLLLTVVPYLILMGLLMGRKMPRTSANLPWLGIAAVAGTVLAAWAVMARGAEPLALWLTVAGMLGLMLYVHWYSRLPKRKMRLEPGSRLPAFTLKALDGGQVSSEKLTRGPSVLIFYRGNWCPLCMAQINELAGTYWKLAALGVRVALISPQPHDQTIALARRFDIDFDFLTDENNQAARTLGIAVPHGLPMGLQMMGYNSETVMPTVIITDGEGRVLWADETDNYRVRPEPDLFLQVLQRHGLGQAVA
ncbi:MAG: hypothetical protein Tsb0016_00990 [Sphingomonadales bacterium]